MNKALPTVICVMCFLLACSPKTNPDKSIVLIEATKNHGSLSINEKAVLSYYIYLPQGYGTKESKGKKYPLLMCLHGGAAISNKISPKLFPYTPLPQLGDSLGKGDKSLAQKNLSAMNPELKESIIVFPQNAYYAGWQPEALDELFTLLQKYYDIDAERIYMTGISGGGIGTWNFAVYHPDLLAAIVPVCGDHLILKDSVKIAAIPSWTFHAINDEAVTGVLLGKNYYTFMDNLTPDTTDDMQSGLPAVPDSFDKTISGTQKYGDWEKGVLNPSGLHTFTLFASGGHEIWGRVYKIDALWDWLYRQKKQ